MTHAPAGCLSSLACASHPCSAWRGGLALAVLPGLLAISPRLLPCSTPRTYSVFLLSVQRLTARDTFREMARMPPEYPPGGRCAHGVHGNGLV